ncbi:MAG: hypothetical protein ACREH8_17450 [Opitutaceae bacterium]
MQHQKYITLLLTLAGAVALHAQPSNNRGKGDPGANSNSGGAPATAGPAQGSTAPRTSAAFDLPRLKSRGSPHAPDAVPKGRATVHELSANGKANARSAASQGVNYVAIDGNTSWSSEVRGAEKDITFVSFFVYASEGTTIDIAGAKIVVRPASEAGKVQMQIGRRGPKGMQWRNFGGPVRLEPYDGAPLAALPILTVRLDGAAGVWDLYVGSRLGVTDMPLPKFPAGATRQFGIRAGSAGARVCGLVSSDDNPLFVDENRNGIDDAFEARQSSGASLVGRKTGSARSQLAKAWQEEQQQQNVRPSPVRRPLPDNAKGKGKAN